MASHEAVAAEVRAELARHRLSGVRAAKALGWSQNYISRRLSGTVPFDVADLAALADLLEVPVTAFFPQSQALARGLIFDKRSPGLGGARDRDYSSLGIAVDAAADLTRSVAAGNDPGGSRPARGLGVAA